MGPLSRLLPILLSNLFAIFTFFHPLDAWEKISKGGEYAKAPSGRTHLFRIDPAIYRLDLLLSSDLGDQPLTAREFRDKGKALLVINGGFFDEKFRSLGLLIQKRMMRNPLRNAEWGVFRLIDGIPSIIHRRDWKGEPVEMAIQVGPRLVIDGRIPSFKPEQEPHRRSALGVTPEGQVILAISEAPVPIGDWASLLKQETSSAINLDGGGSSQISVKIRDFSLEIPGTTPIPNAVAVFSQTSR